MQTYNIREDFVQSKDGTLISYKIIGKGPALLIVHGTLRASQHYLRLAKILSEDYTVYVQDRRGRNNSGSKGEDYSVQKECEDTIAILRKHNIPYLFGHSYGGLISLNVSLQHSIKKLAVYEPALFNFFESTEFLDRFEIELKRKDYISGTITFIKNMKIGVPNLIRILPRPILNVLFRTITKGSQWMEHVELLQTVLEEIKAGINFYSNLMRYKQITTPSLVLRGTYSPKYLITSVMELEYVMPNSQSKILKRMNHNAPDGNAPKKIANILHNYFKSNVVENNNMELYETIK